MIKEQILKSVISANQKYLNNVLNKIPDDKKEFAKNSFNQHMNIISDYCYKEVFENNNFSEKFLRELHKIHFPKWYTETTIKDWIKVITMIPWVYRSNENYMWVRAYQVKKEMNILFNNIWNLNSFDEIAIFLLNFLRIHPFWNGNWRIWSIIFDLLLIKNNLKPYFLREKLKKYEKEIFKKIEKSLKTKNNSYFLETLKKYN